MSPAQKNIDIRDAIFNTIHDLARKDRSILFLTADLGAYALNAFMKEMPDQFINVGISEQNLVSVGAGLAMGGKKVFLYSIIPFMTGRCFDQIKIDVGLMGLPVAMIGAGAGFAYSHDGPTHQGIDDVALMRTIPGMAIAYPSDGPSAKAAILHAASLAGPAYIRIDNGAPPHLHGDSFDFNPGASLLREGKDVLLVASGRQAHQALVIADLAREKGLSVGVLELFRLKPSPDELLLEAIVHYDAVASIEEHCPAGGLGSLLADLLVERGVSKPLLRFSAPDRYIHELGGRAYLDRLTGLEPDRVASRLVESSKGLAANSRGGGI